MEIDIFSPLTGMNAEQTLPKVINVGGGTKDKLCYDNIRKHACSMNAYNIAGLPRQPQNGHPQSFLEKQIVITHSLQGLCLQ